MGLFRVTQTRAALKHIFRNFSKSPGNLPIISIRLLRRARGTAERRHPAISYNNLTSRLFKALEAFDARFPLPVGLLA